MRVLAEQNRAFGYAIAASLALHALALAVRVPALRQTEPATSEAPLVARLVERGAPAPAAPATLPVPPPAQKPEPAKPAVRASPAPPKRKRVAEPKPLVKSAPRASAPITPSAERQAEDADRDEAALGPAAPAPAPEAAPPVSATAPPAGVAVAPAANSDPKAERDRFRQEVIERAERIKRYPKRAVDEGWAGQVTVRIEIADNGSVASVRVKASSGNSLLDAVAVEIFSKAAAQVAVPPALRGKAFAVEVPAIYKFTD